MWALERQRGLLACAFGVGGSGRQSPAFGHAARNIVRARQLVASRGRSSRCLAFGWYAQVPIPQNGGKAYLGRALQEGTKC